ncbi:MAG: hypothetical protein C0594_04715 [Marinilabiliales bacterium]|nr:MAG: hypothetical protein C0594_04715 [Marinilabiliales bacterium]
MKEICAGTSKDAEKFRNFLGDHASGEYPPELVIVIGNAEKGNPNNMLNNTKKYFKLRFDKYKGNDIGQPLFMGSANPYPTGQEQMMPLSFQGFGQSRQGGMSGMGGFTYRDIQGIIDKNVTDAARSIKAEYQEVSAKREAEAIKRIAELEMKMELYKLDLRAKEIEDKEQKLREELEGLEERRAEGLGTVKEYTKTIAGGLFELGKSAFGLDEVEEKLKKRKQRKKEEEQEDIQGTSSTQFDDEGFEEKSGKENKKEDSFGQLMGLIKGLDEEQKFALLDVLMPEEPDEEREPDNPEEKPKKEEETKQNTEENENIPSDDND